MAWVFPPSDVPLESIFFLIKPMGQYFVAVNKTKKEFICPWCVGGVAKLWEWAANPWGSLFTILLRKSDASGGGDFYGYAPKTMNAEHLSQAEQASAFAESLMEITAKEGAPAHPAPGTIVGRWAGDEVYLVGDYDSSQLFGEAFGSYQNVSQEVVETWNSFMDLEDQQLKYNSGCTCQMPE